MFHLEGYWLRSVTLFYFMYSMNNVLNSIVEESMRKGAKTLIDEVLKLDPNEITNNTAEVLNELLKGVLVMNVNKDMEVLKLTSSYQLTRLNIYYKKLANNYNEWYLRREFTWGLESNCG